MSNSPTTEVIVGEGTHRYRWNGEWAKVPAEINGEAVKVGRTHGVQVAADGRVFVFNQSRHAVLILQPDGSFAGTWGEFPSDRFLGAHGMTIHTEGSEQFLWLADEKSFEVVKTTLDGEAVLRLPKPVSYDVEDKYVPTWVAQAPAARGGKIYLADGYGSSRISVYDADGAFLETFDGSAGAGAFKCPHAVYITQRASATGVAEPVLYVTDRGNSRVEVFDLAGKYLGGFEQEHPCCFDHHLATGDLLVPDLRAFVCVYNAGDELVATLGNHREIVGQHGWPNVAEEHLHAGKFNSPHGGCFDADGNIYIVEWHVNGRITKLEKC